MVSAHCEQSCHTHCQKSGGTVSPSEWAFYTITHFSRPHFPRAFEEQAVFEETATRGEGVTPAPSAHLQTWLIALPGEASATALEGRCSTDAPWTLSAEEQSGITTAFVLTWFFYCFS